MPNMESLYFCFNGRLGEKDLESFKQTLAQIIPDLKITGVEEKKKENGFSQTTFFFDYPWHFGYDEAMDFGMVLKKVYPFEEEIKLYFCEPGEGLYGAYLYLPDRTIWDCLPPEDWEPNFEKGWWEQNSEKKFPPWWEQIQAVLSEDNREYVGDFLTT